MDDSTAKREKEVEIAAKIQHEQLKFEEFYAEFKANWEEIHDVKLTDLENEFKARIFAAWKDGLR